MKGNQRGNCCNNDLITVPRVSRARDRRMSPFIIDTAGSLNTVRIPTRVSRGHIRMVGDASRNVGCERFSARRDVSPREGFNYGEEEKERERKKNGKAITKPLYHVGSYYYHI